jgi:methylmalonyl-CoA/ethylmalonyl-CoA epimerase
MSSLNNFTFHHLGVACESIAAEIANWELLGYHSDGAPFVDEEQGIRGLFMVGGGPRIELLEAISGSSTLTPWIKRRVKLYHMGYLVDSFDAVMETLIADGATVARSPMISLFFGARIVFLMMPNMALIELVDTQRNRPTADLELHL